MTHMATSRMALRIVAIAALAGLSAACGYKGPLYLPPASNAPADSTPPPASVPAASSTPVPALPSPGTATLPTDPNANSTTRP